MKRNLLKFIIITALVSIAGALVYLLTGALSPGIEISIIYTGCMEGSMLDLPCNRLGPSRDLYRIPSIIDTVSILKRQLKEKGLDPLYMELGDTLSGVDDFASFRGGRPVLELLAEVEPDLFIAGPLELDMNPPPDFDEKIPYLMPSIKQEEGIPQKIIVRGPVKAHVFYFYEDVGSGEFLGREIIHPSVDQLNRELKASECPVRIVVARVNSLDDFTGRIRGAHLVIPGRFYHQLEPNRITEVNGVKVAPFAYSRCHGAALLKLKVKGSDVKGSVAFHRPETPAPLPDKLKPLYEDFKKQYGADYRKIHTSILAVGSSKLSHSMKTVGDTPSSVAVADMIRNFAGTDIALVNLLSVRRPLGGIFRGDYMEWLLPFENELVTMELTGVQISAILENNRFKKSSYIVLSGGGVKYFPKGLKVEINGQWIDGTKTYSVATNNYLARSEKPDYRVFRTGKNIRCTGIPIGAAVLSHMTKTGYLLPPPRVKELMTRNEVAESIDPLQRINKAYELGYFDLLSRKKFKGLNPETEKLRKTRSLQGALYSGIIGRDTFAKALKKNSSIIPPGDLEAFMGLVRFRQGNRSSAGVFWKKAGELKKDDPDYVRLGSLIGSPVKQAERPPIWPGFKYDNRRTGLCPFIGPFKNPKVLWKFATHHSNKSSPALGWDGTVYFGGGDGFFYAVGKDGREKWNFQTGSYILSSPAIGIDGVIYVGGAPRRGGSGRRAFHGKENETEPSSHGFLLALNPDGTVKWRFDTGGWVASSPAVDADGSVTVGCNDFHLYRINSDGTLRWKYKTENRILSSPAIGEKGNVYFGGEDCYFYALTSSGRLINRYRADNKFFSSPAVDKKGRVYIGNDDSHLYCFNSQGLLLWKKKFPAPVTSTVSIGADGDLYVGCENGVLYRMRGKDKIIWTFSGGDEFFSSPIIDAKGNIFIGCEDNNLYCISKEGRLLWKLETGDYLESTVALSPDGVLYLTAEDKYLYAITGDKND